MRLIADGEVERSGVPGLAAHLGYSERQLHRQLVGELGVGALALARAQRAQTARVLIETTDLPMADIAFAAGFASIRQFNDTVREVFATTPTGLRHTGHRAQGAPGWLTLRLAARAPYEAAEVLLFLGAHAVPGLEEWDGTTFSRVLDLPHGPAVVQLTPAPRAARASPLASGSASSAISAPRSPGAAGCSTSTPTRPPWTTSSVPTRRSRRWCPPRPAAACPRPRTPRSWPCGPCSVSRSPWPAPAH